MKPYKAGILLGEKTNPFWAQMKQAYEIKAPEFAISPLFAWPVPGNGPETQAASLCHLIEHGCDALIVNPLNRFNLVSGIMEAASRGIPVLDVGGKADRHSLRSAEPFYTPVTTVDFYQQGRLGAACIINRLRTAGRVKVAIIEGSWASTQSIERSRGASDAFEETPDIHVAARIFADFHRHKAAEASRRILKTHPDMAAFFCANDDMALGVAETVRSMGNRNRIIIVGVDLISEAEQAILSGTMHASVAFSVQDVAEALLDAAVKRINGHPLTKGPAVTSRLVERHDLVA